MLKARKILNSNKGETYIGVVIFILVAVFMIMFMLQIGGVVMAKLSLDNEAKQIVKSIQLEGGITDNSQKMIDDVRNKYTTEKGETLNVSVTGENMTLVDGTTDKYHIQLGDAFEVDLKCGYRIGFGNMSITVPLTSKQVGVSECYWKELDS